MKRGGLFGLTGIAAAACLLAAAAPVSAGGPGATVHLGTSKGLEYKKATYPGVVTQVALPVTCDAGTEAIGGGGAISDPNSATALNESYPTLPEPSGWTVEGSGPPVRVMTGYAICAPFDVMPVNVSEQVNAGTSITNTASCDAGDEAAGGGIEATNVGVVINQSFPPQPQGDFGTWLGGAQNLALNERVVYYHVTCTDDYQIRYRSESVKVQPDKNGKVAVSCARKESVLGGGLATLFEGSPVAGPRANVTRPTDSKKDGNKVPDDGWAVQIFNGSVSPVKLQAHAVCTRRLAA